MTKRKLDYASFERCARYMADHNSLIPGPPITSRRDFLKKFLGTGAGMAATGGLLTSCISRDDPALLKSIQEPPKTKPLTERFMPAKKKIADLPKEYYSQDAKAKTQDYLIPVYLTIDDGPLPTDDRSKYNMEILFSELKPEQYVTFFMVGDKIERNPDIAIRALQLGHSIGNHTYSHKHLSECTMDQVVDEINMAHDLIEEIYSFVGFKNPRLFRFPYNDKGNTIKRVNKDGKPIAMTYEIQEYLDLTGYKRIGYDIETLDWHLGSGSHDTTLEEVLANCSAAKSSQIVLLHDREETMRRVITYFCISGKYELRKL